ncbi:MAG: hypothetical protein ABEN55_10920 [Bradymonadaceae bacterium]
MDEFDQLIAELLLEEDETLEERFVQYLLMERTIQALRELGYSNVDILRLCQRIDDRQHDEPAQTKRDRQEGGPAQEGKGAA